MRILFDNGTPRGVAIALSGHIVEEARSRGWVSTMANCGARVGHASQRKHLAGG
jgi:hypothetical protein